MTEEEDDFDLDSALDAWAEDFDRNTSQFPSAPAPSDGPRQSERPTSPPSGKARALASEYPIFSEDDEDDESTRVASIPKGLIGALGEVELEGLFGEVGAPAPPPSAIEVDVDVDSLLFDLDEDEQVRDVDLGSFGEENEAVTVVKSPKLPTTARRSNAPRVPPPVRAVRSRVPPRVKAPEPSAPRESEPSLDADLERAFGLSQKTAAPSPREPAPTAPRSEPSASVPSVVSEPPAPTVPPLGAPSLPSASPSPSTDESPSFEVAPPMPLASDEGSADDFDLVFGDVDGSDAEEQKAPDASPSTGVSDGPGLGADPLEESAASANKNERTDVGVDGVDGAKSDGPELAFGDPTDEGPELAFGDVDDGPELAFGDASDEELAFGEPANEGPELAFGDVDDGPELAFGDASDEGPELAFGEPADEGPELAFGEPADEGPELAFGEPADDGPELAFGEPADEGPELAFGEPADEGPELAFGEPANEGPELAFGDADDGPELAFGNADDGPELAFGEASDAAASDEHEDEPALSVEDDGGMEGDDDVFGAAEDPLDGPKESTERRDGGAAAAQRSVTRRKPRRETYRFVGHSTETQRARIVLLERLAKHAEGSARAGLLLSAAEIAMQVGNAEDARAFTRAAHEADPSDLLALRSLRRDAMARGDWSEVEAFLVDELALPVSDLDRAVAARLLAETRLHQTRDVLGAIEAARQGGESLAAHLLHAAALDADGNRAAAVEALSKASSGWGDADGEAALRLLVDREKERSGETLKSAAGLTGALNPARTEEVRAVRAASVKALAERAQSGLLRELAGRTALLLGDTDEVEATRATTHRTLARVRDGERREASLASLAASTGGTARALALVDLAEARAARDDLEGADEALRDAHLADSALQAVQVVREVIARRAGDGQRLARAIEDGSGRGAIEGAARVRSAHTGSAELERTQLAHALDEALAPLTADTLLLDLAGETKDGELLLRQLRRYSERATGQQRVGALLALAERSDAPVEALAEARDHAPGHAAVTRPLARLLRESNPERAAAAWLEESDSAERDRAAHAALIAARTLLAAGRPLEAQSAARRAFDLQGSDGPAAWLLQGDGDGGLEGEDLAIFLEELGDSDADSGATAHVISALRTGSAHGWARATALAPHDPVARRKMVNAAGVDALARAKALETIAEESADIPAVRRMARMRAGILQERGGDPHAAAAHYRAVLEVGDDPIAERFLDRAELGSGGFARVAERRFARVRETAGTSGALGALESLAAVDLYERDDPRSAFLTLQSILEEAPGHLPTLRAIERYFMDQNRDDELTRITRALAEHLDGQDAAAAARAAVHLMVAADEARGDAADGFLLSQAPRLVDAGEDGRWLATRLLSAECPREDRAKAVRVVAEGLGPEERAVLLLSERESLVGGEEDAAQLAEAMKSAEEGAHVLLSEVRAELLEEAGDAPLAAVAYSRAASQAKDTRHQLELLVAEARCWRAAERTDAAVVALESAAALDVTFGSVFEELRTHYQETGAAQKLASLAEQRVAAGADEDTLLSLHETQARLKTSLGDRQGAKDALRAALTIDANRSESLERLARLCLEDEEWSDAAESLVRFARVKQSREKLRWVFFELGTIYDRHLPDPRRAEAAYRRVLKLAPDDLEALERLADFYFRHEMWGQATIAQKELHRREIDPDAKIAHLVRLSRAYEEAGKLRVAEQTLDEQRRRTPHDLPLLRALADLYERQNAQSALSMHLGRAVGDFRRRIEESPTDPEGWTGLTDVLGWRNQSDGGRAVASAALAAGVSDITLASRLDAAGGITGGGAAAADPGLHELLAPSLLTPATLEVFRQAGETLDKLLPFEPRAWRAEKADRSREALKAEAARIARWYGFSEVQLWIADAAPRVCVPFGDRSLGIVLGRELAERASGEERAFLFARAAKVAASQLSVAMRSSPEQLGLYLAALISLYDPHHTGGFDARSLDQAAKRVSRTLPRRVRDAIGAVVVEMGGTAGFDAARLGLAAAQLGDRTALLALGNAPKAINALLRLAGISAPGQRADERIESLRQVPEALDLVRFATSDHHFEARRRVGADRG